MHKALRITSDLLFGVGLVVAGLFLVGRLTGKMPLNVFIVSSGSMAPAVKTGSVVLVTPQPIYYVGDIITFYTSASKKSTTTHRIVGIGDQTFRVAGDANDQPDPGLVSKDNVVGSVSLVIPYIGYLAAFAKTPRGFILLVIIPATIIVYEELKSLFLEIKKNLKKIIPSPKLGEGQGGVLRPAIILPILIALLIPLTLTISYFIDRETAAGNSFMGTAPVPTATPTPTPTP